MRFLADEDFPKPLVNKIRRIGHSVKTIQQSGYKGASDNTVIGIAKREKRIIITFDKDFLEKENRQMQLIVFRFAKTPTTEVISLIESFLKDLKKVKGHINHEFGKTGLKQIK